MSYCQDNFPGLYLKESGNKANLQLDQANEIAELMHLQFNVLGLESGIVIGNKLPEKEESEGFFMDQAIKQALKEAENNKINGEDLVQFIRDRVNELAEQLNFTGQGLWEGSSTRFNLGLMRNNIELGCQVIKELMDFTKNVFGNWEIQDIFTEENQEIEDIIGIETKYESANYKSNDSTKEQLNSYYNKLVNKKEYEIMFDSNQSQYEKPTVLFVLGGPGSGKGTQCKKLVEKYQFVHLSTGDLLRQEVDSGSENGQKLKKVMDEGELVSTSDLIGLIKAAMESHGWSSSKF